MLKQKSLDIEIRKANRRFYDAFESLDINQMHDIWLRADRIQCVHPGWNYVLRGWKEVMQSFYTIFENTSYIEFNLEDVAIENLADSSVVTCTERIVNAAGEELLRTEVYATNIYQNLDDTWWLIHHHGSGEVFWT